MGTDEMRVTSPCTVSLEAYMACINQFDGSRHDLLPFLHTCDWVMSDAPVEKSKFLLAYIISQLRGRAQIRCPYKDIKSYEDLKIYLKQNFADTTRETDLYHHDIRLCKQRKNEQIKSFISRFKNIWLDLIISIHHSTEIKEEVYGRVSGADQTALVQFMLAVHQDLSKILISRSPKDLREAFCIALEEEAYKNTQKQLNCLTITKKVINCQFCGKSGHFAKNCYNNKK